MSEATCPSVNICYPVGDYTDSATNQDHGLIETLVQGSWTATNTPLPSPASSVTGSDLDLISCPSEAFCLATGGYYGAGSARRGLVEILSRGAWVATEAPADDLDPSAGNNLLVLTTALSCASRKYCVAVGEYYDSPMLTSSHAFMETYSSGKLTAISARIPDVGSAAATTNQLVSFHAVSCPAVHRCVAVGNVSDTTGMNHGLIESLSGDKWTALSAPLTSLDPPAG